MHSQETYARNSFAISCTLFTMKLVLACHHLSDLMASNGSRPN